MTSTISLPESTAELDGVDPAQHAADALSLEGSPVASSAGVRCLTIDVEEYFHIEAAHGVIGRDQWNGLPSRVEASVDLLLELFGRRRRRGTFFVLGDVARRCPRLAGRIAAAGHEVASHGMEHDRLHRLDPRRFREDVRRSKGILEDQTGREVMGYRAPTFSVVRATAWAIDVLAEVGFGYDASIFPVRHPAYGVPEAPDRPFMVRGPGGAEILEVPPLTWTWPEATLGDRPGRRKIAVAGGGYFRLLPLWLMERGLAQAKRQRRPAVLYFHPWEFDPGIPRMPLGLVGKLRTYTGLRRAARRLERVVGPAGEWAPVADALPMMRRMAEESPVFVL